jgi:hypothetical protein
MILMLMIKLMYALLVIIILLLSFIVYLLVYIIQKIDEMETDLHYTHKTVCNIRNIFK